MQLIFFNNNFIALPLSGKKVPSLTGSKARIYLITLKTKGVMSIVDGHG